MSRIGHLVGDQWVAHSHRPVFTADDRIVAGIPGSNPSLIGHLAECLEPPYNLLYVLHTSRGEGEPGRYQSPALSRDQLMEFLTTFAPFLSGDGRFDLWVHSPASGGTLVWDRHDRLFGYGPIDRLSDKLTSLGFIEGKPEIPAPHEHHYRAELDSLAKQVIAAFEWSHSPLRPEDEQ